MSDIKTLTVVVPVYYNEHSLLELNKRLTEVRRDLQALAVGLELVFVDDGSGDGSLGVLLRLRESDTSMKVIRHARNFGSFAALKTGIAFAHGDCVATLSADLQDPPELLVEMTRRWLAGSKFVVAVRAQRRDPFTTKAFAQFYYWLLRWLVFPEYPKGGFDFMLADRALAAHIVNGPKNVNVNLYAYWLGFTPSVIAYERSHRAHGVSRWTFAKRINLFFNTFTGFSVRPLRLMSGFGLIAAALSLLYALFILVRTLALGSPQPGFPTLAILISFFSGLIIFMLGLIGEYLWRVFDAINRKPEAVIEQVFE